MRTQPSPLNGYYCERLQRSAPVRGQRIDYFIAFLGCRLVVPDPDRPKWQMERLGLDYSK